MAVLQWLLLSISLSVLAGCDGGGNGSPNNNSSPQHEPDNGSPAIKRPAPDGPVVTDPEPEVQPEPNSRSTTPGTPDLEPELELVERTETRELQVQESSESNEPVRGDIQSISRVTGDTSIALSESVGGVQILITELQNDALARFEVVSATDTEIITTFVTVNAINTSAQPLLVRSDALTGLPLNQSALQDEERLARILLEIEYLAGNLTRVEHDEKLNGYLDNFNTVNQVFRNTVERLGQVTTDYRDGIEPESRLQTTLSDAEATASSLSIAGELPLIELRNVLEGLDVVLPTNLEQDLPLVFDERQGRYTRFTNPSLGRYDANGNWVFFNGTDGTPDFDFLNSALLLKGTAAADGGR